MQSFFLSIPERFSLLSGFSREILQSWLIKKTIEKHVEIPQKPDQVHIRKHCL